MASVRIRVGLREYQLDADARPSVGAGLAPREAIRMLAAIRDPATLAVIRSAAIGAGARSFEWDEELGPQSSLIIALLETGRLRVRLIEAQSLRVLSGEERPELEPEREENQIDETHSVMIELIDAEGNPVPGEPFRIELPDGSVRTSKLDERGKAHVTGIKQPGTCKVCFYERDASIWAPA